MIRRPPRSTLFPSRRSSDLYLVKPLIPEVVRTKVAIFAELFRQRKQIERQAAALVDAERKDRELRLAELRLARSEEHTSELQSQFHLVCRLLLEKKKNTKHA